MARRVQTFFRYFPVSERDAGVPACEDMMNLPCVRAVRPDSRPSVPPGVTREG